MSNVRWLGVPEAAAILGLAIVSLRRIIERSARRGASGVLEAQIDGLHARKFGRLWRVRLDEAWTATTPKR